MVNNKFNYEFHTIILAGGRGSRMNAILNGRPKCLLSINNKPLIQYTLELLKRFNILEAYIIVLDNEKDQIKNVITSIIVDLNIRLKFITIPHTGDYATADSLRIIQQQEKLTKDLLILSCDTITDINLDEFINFYRLRNPTFLCAVSSKSYPKEYQLPAIKLKDNNKEFDYIGLSDCNRLIYYQPDVIDTITIKRSMLEYCPNFQLRTDLIDSHIYLFQNWILDYLQHEISIQSIKFDLLPSLVRKQFRHRINITTTNDLNEDGDQPKNNSKKINNFIKKSKLETNLMKINVKQCNNNNKECSLLINCYAFVYDENVNIRVNNLLGYCLSNRYLIDQQHQPSSIHNTNKFGEKTIIKKLIIGNNCKIGEQCKLFNCIIQDNVIIDNNCTIIDTIICSDVYIETNVSLENCLVGIKNRINKDNHYRNETLIQEMIALI